MTLQSISTQKLTNQLPVSPGTGRLWAILGPSSGGTLNTPIAKASPSDVVSEFSQGPLVEAACYALGNYADQVVCVRTAASTAAVCSAITASRAAVASPGSASTSVCTVDSGSSAAGDYEFGFVVTKVILAAGTAAAQGTLGTDTIYGKWTVDNFRTLSPEVKLPASATFSVDLAKSTTGFDSGIQLNFAAGTLTVGDTFTGVSTAPAVTVSDLTTPLLALGNTALPWEFVLLASAISDSTPSTGVCGTMDAFIAGLMARGQFRWWMGHAAMPTVSGGTAQTDSAYQSSSAITNFAAYASSTPAIISQRACLLASRNPSWPAQYILPQAYAIAPMAKSVAEEISIADSDLGPLPGISLRDGNRNPIPRCGDEALSQGADDARFCVLRTWSDVEGVYVNLPTLMSQSGSDFTILQRLRVWNLFATTVWSFFRHRLQKGVAYDEETGFILEEYADNIETDANLIIHSALTAKRKCVDAKVRVSRTDDYRVPNPTMTVEGGVQPLGYPTFIVLRLGFLLPS